MLPGDGRDRGGNRPGAVRDVGHFGEGLGGGEPRVEAHAEHGHRGPRAEIRRRRVLPPDGLREPAAKAAASQVGVGMGGVGTRLMNRSVMLPGGVDFATDRPARAQSRASRAEAR